MKNLFDRGALGRDSLEEKEGEVRILEGRALGRAQQLEDELELLKIRLEAKRSEQEGSQAEVDAAKANLAALQRRKGTSFTINDEITTAEAELRHKDANRAVRVAEVREIEVRIRQVERRLLALDPLLKDANRGKDADAAPTPASTEKPGRSQ